MGRHQTGHGATRLARRLSRAAAWLLVVGASLGWAARAAGAERPLVVWLQVRGPITPATVDYIDEGLEVAQRRGAAALVLQIDTPGGLLSSTRAIVQRILGSPLPVISYVAPAGAGAASAGVFVVMSANVAAMAPGTNIGASTPVLATGGDLPGAMGSKVKSFTASFAKAIAEERGRNVAWAARAVRRAVSATDREALEKHVIDLIAADAEALLAKVDGRSVVVGDGREVLLELEGARIEHLDPSLRQQVMGFLADPNVAYLLMLAGLLGLYLELSHPGTLVPGLVGGLCLAISLASFQILPIDTTGMVLLLAGLALLVAELFLPSFGVVGGVGLVAFVLGSLLLFDGSEPGVYVDRTLIGSAAAAVGTVMLVVALLVVRAMGRRAATGREALVGSVGEVRTWSAPHGTVFVHGELWQAHSAEPIAVGASAKVVAVDGLTLQVVPLEEERKEE